MIRKRERKMVENNEGSKEFRRESRRRYKKEGKVKNKERMEEDRARK